MKFRKSIVLAVLASVSAIAVADHGPFALIERTSSILRRLQRSVDYLSPQQMDEISKGLDRIEQALRYPAPMMPALRCVSQDDDGRAPYQLAVDVSPVRFMKIEGTVSRTLEQCQGFLNDSRLLDRTTFFCAPRDNDGRAPYALSILDLDHYRVNVIKALSVKTREECVANLQSAVELTYPESQLKFCTARDDDGRAPYARAVLNAAGQLSKSADVYNTFEECRRAL